jgi:hypothetical protein
MTGNTTWLKQNQKIIKKVYRLLVPDFEGTQI